MVYSTRKVYEVRPLYSKEYNIENILEPSSIRIQWKSTSYHFVYVKCIFNRILVKSFLVEYFK